MPYKTNSDLPDSVKDVLPAHAQTIFREAFNNAYKLYKDPDKRRLDGNRYEVSFRVAWSAVKKKFEKGSGKKWHSIKE